MAGISAIGSERDLYGQIASGNRINSAADDAAGLSISEQLKKQTTGLDVGAQNAQDGVSLLKISDGALGQIGDSLGRIHELSLKAMNGLSTADEKNAIQQEISGLMDEISSVAKGTEFNTLKVLDGTFADIDMATNPKGDGPTIKMANATLEALGIDGYDVTGKFDLSRITDAIDKVSAARSNLGASQNALESAYRSNSNTSLNTTAAQSSLADLDIAKAISEQKKSETLNNYQLMMQRKQQEDEEKKKLGILQF